MSVSTMPAHWPLGGSSAKRWVNCPGSKYAGLDEAPDEVGEKARIGTLGHKAVEQLLRRGYIDLTDEDRELLSDMDADRRDWFKRAIKMCVDCVRAEIAKADEFILEYQAESVTIPDHGGTMDVVTLRGDTLHVIDYKFGATPVEAAGNEQLMSYLLLALQRFPQATEFRGTIIQPSHRGVDTVDFTAEELDEFHQRAQDAADPANEERYADTSWCMYCPLLATCDTAAKLTVSAVDEFGALPRLLTGIDVGSNPTEEQVERLERIVMMHKLAKAAYDKASAVLKQWYNDGADLQYHRVTGTNRRNWKPTAPERLQELYGDLVVKTDVVTPADLQKKIGMKKKEFDEAHSDLLDYTCTQTLRAGVNPSAGELAQDLPIYKED